MPEKKRIKNRQLVISSLIIVAIISLTILIIYQYNKYYQIEKRLNAAYTSTNFQSLTLYKLFSTFSEADYLFRLYAINFKEEDFDAYSQKLDSVKIVIDSLSTLPLSNNPIRQHGISDNALVSEYLQLKKQVDYLVLYAKDTLALTISKNEQFQQNDSISRLTPPEDIIENILSDTSLNNTQQDTIVKKKKSLFKRIFQSTDDTLINNNQTEINLTEQRDLVLRKNLELYFSNNNRIYNNNINQLRSAFSKLQKKEKQLLFANFTLLHNLKTGIEKLRLLDDYNYRKNQELDFFVYTENTESIRIQLIGALSLMVLMVILIISYQKQVYIFEKRLIKEKYYADQIAEEKTSVLANISHEIRTPLNSLKGLVNILKKNNNNDHIDEAIIQLLDHDITVVTSTINDILSLSKLESDSLQIKNETINIYTLIEDLIGLHYYQAQSKKLDLINNNSLLKNITIVSNPFRIKQVVSNLITNAIKYTEKGQIKVISQIVNSTLIIKVEDTGIGISKEQSEQVFRKYYVADNKNKAGGFGLGLYISKILSEQIDGKLTFQSTLGKGTTFTFELPLNSMKESEKEKTKLHTIDEIPSDIKIVFIDDSKINLFFAQQLFTGRENVDFFLDEQKAIQHIKAHRTDIVITDLKMPNLSGWEILHLIKSDETLVHTRVFVSTAEPLLLESNKSKYHFDAIINKPIQVDELVMKILDS